MYTPARQLRSSTDNSVLCLSSLPTHSPGLLFVSLDLAPGSLKWQLNFSKMPHYFFALVYSIWTGLPPDDPNSCKPFFESDLANKSIHTKQQIKRANKQTKNKKQQQNKNKQKNIQMDKHQTQSFEWLIPSISPLQKQKKAYKARAFLYRRWSRLMYRYQII